MPKEELRCELSLDFGQCCISDSVNDVRYNAFESWVPVCAGFLPPLSVQADVDIKVGVSRSWSILSEWWLTCSLAPAGWSSRPCPTTLRPCSPATWGRPSRTRWRWRPWTPTPCGSWCSTPTQVRRSVHSWRGPAASSLKVPCYAPVLDTSWKGPMFLTNKQWFVWGNNDNS